ncbi:jg13104 [Pararge aegeria aegeria]|uniref:Jg13104 protein n=1 Tax=Pararge aegeria aegeria TaxID=348720 RepID=A0A8S4RC79_9NEOP|nr:jg13104 [Pararge aegeria aegeria]
MVLIRRVRVTLGAMKTSMLKVVKSGPPRSVEEQRFKVTDIAQRVEKQKRQLAIDQWSLSSQSTGMVTSHL